MAQNISLLGAQYNAVPAILVPKTGGGTARFTDVTPTDAVESDVTQGKIFFKADGSQGVGSNSGGGGGASNIVMGEFTTPSSAGVTNINIPYTGNGHPIAAMVFVKGGAYNNTSSGQTNWYSSVQRYAVGQWTMHKSVQDSNPTYGTSGTQNQGVTTAIYKNSTSTATPYTRTSAMNTNVFSSSNATNAALTCVRLKSGNVLSYYTNTSSYGLHPNTTYTYIIIYSE